MREIKEEVGISNFSNLKTLGYINNESDEVGKVHFGILFIAETKTSKINLRNPELEKGEWIFPEEIKQIFSNPNLIIEKWSRISFLPLKDYLQLK